MLCINFFPRSYTKLRSQEWTFAFFLVYLQKKHNTNKKVKLKYVWFTKTYIRVLQQ